MGDRDATNNFKNPGNEDGLEIPVVDFSGEREDIVKGVAEACRNWGFFQAINHGVQVSSMHRLLQAVSEFFNMTLEEKQACTIQGDDPSGIIKYYEQTTRNDWRDALLLHFTYLDELRAWPSSPLSFNDVICDYDKQLTQFTKQTVEVIGDGLGLKSGKPLPNLLTRRRVYLMNHYLPAPDPQLVQGARPHSDPGGITMLLQDSVGGLEIRKDGRWFPVKPISDAFVVNLGDQFQILTNSRYQSVEHRVRSSTDKFRISVAMFSGFHVEDTVGPLPELVSQDGHPMYRECTVKEYLRNFHLLGQSGGLDYVTIKTGSECSPPVYEICPA